jgi:hypothetical protein
VYEYAATSADLTTCNAGATVGLVTFDDPPGDFNADTHGFARG